VITAKNGREALTRCCPAGDPGDPRTQIDLVITDLIMPEMGGEEMLNELQKISPNLPVLAVTGYALQDEDIDKLREIGFVDVLSKPIDMEQLARVVQRMAALDL
jgi:CheY-like chemotaxis protein